MMKSDKPGRVPEKSLKEGGLMMKHTPQLIQKAKGKLCRFCMEYITEIEADNCEFEYSQNSSRREVFVHSRCWEKENCK